MKTILSFLKFLSKNSEQREREREEAYLAQSTDRYDLEYRMRKLDRQSQSRPAGMGATGS